MNWLVIALCLAIVLTNVGCGGINQPAEGLLHDARVQIGVAKRAEAATLASQELADAEQMLVQAETALSEDDDQAYRLGIRAYLNARLAEAAAILKRNENRANDVEKELELKLRAADTALRQLEKAEDELERLKATPP